MKTGYLFGRKNSSANPKGSVLDMKGTMLKLWKTSWLNKNWKQ